VLPMRTPPRHLDTLRYVYVMFYPTYSFHPSVARRYGRTYKMFYRTVSALPCNGMHI
jgi:hypothetical protein